ncbi:hypothetical protein GCM10025762_25430 [Haloechinothrix salitolerans]
MKSQVNRVDVAQRREVLFVETKHEDVLRGHTCPPDSSVGWSRTEYPDSGCRTPRRGFGGRRTITPGVSRGWNAIDAMNAAIMLTEMVV